MNNFFKRYVFKIIIALIIIFGISYMWFIVKGFFPTGTDITKSDWLSFWGSFLAFAGALFLGAVSVWQNEQANETNKELINLNREINQTQFKNELLRMKYTTIINGIQQVSSKIFAICEKLTKINIDIPESAYNHTDKFTYDYIARMLESVSTELNLLNKIDLDIIIPIEYDNEFPILKRNRNKMKEILQKNENKIRDFEQNLLKHEIEFNNSYNFVVNLPELQEPLIEIASYFHQKINSVNSYTSFIENKEQQNND